MLVYRVEREESGWGPYRSKDYDYWHRRVARHRHPVPFDDFDSDPPSYAVKFGFSSQEQLAAWFTPAELRRLRKHGFNVNADVIVGRHRSPSQLRNDRAAAPSFATTVV